DSGLGGLTVWDAVRPRYYEKPPVSHEFLAGALCRARLARLAKCSSQKFMAYRRFFVVSGVKDNTERVQIPPQDFSRRDQFLHTRP
ncbi:MAG: hypothetical protein R6U38_06250, partial [Desulfatiglandaceae bacterium]